jgi:hypothetical protein
MTEAEWLACEGPYPMLEWLGDRMSVRKLRLFACGCCRQVWTVLTDPRSRQAVELAERFADGRVHRDAFDEMYLTAMSARGDSWPEPGSWTPQQIVGFHAAQAAAWCCAQAPAWRASTEAVKAFRAFAQAKGTTDDVVTLGRQAQAKLLRELVGNPFKLVPDVTRWLTWNDGAVRKLAQAIYDDRRFGDLPVLADALEDAGCDNEDILNHCRNGGEHVRGCWVLDLLLGKE